VDQPIVVLPPKRKKFVEEYLKDLNATQAYIRAGYRPKDEKTAAANASALVANHKVAAYLRQRQERLEKKTGVTQERVIAEYAKLAFFDVRKMFDEKGAFKPIGDLDDETVGAIAGFDVHEEYDKDTGKATGRTVKVKLPDKRAALYDLGRHLGMFGDEVTLRLTLKELKDMSLDEKERLLRQLEENRNN